jgi:hypothetical protein
LSAEWRVGETSLEQQVVAAERCGGGALWRRNGVAAERRGGGMTRLRPDAGGTGQDGGPSPEPWTGQAAFWALSVDILALWKNTVGGPWNRAAMLLPLQVSHFPHYVAAVRPFILTFLIMRKPCMVRADWHQLSGRQRLSGTRIDNGP